MEQLRELLDDASLSTVLTGRSVIDFPRLQLQNKRECGAFIECYGYDLEEDKDEIEALRLEALSFLRNNITVSSFKLPKRLVETTDIRQYLHWASESKRSAIALWSCSLLRVIHTLVHCNSFFNEQYHLAIRDQIVSRIEANFCRENNRIFLGDIELVEFQFRPVKTRESVAIKLLHKTENISADIFDWLGLRFITKDRLDALRTLIYLRKINAVMFANVKPSRSRNTLIDLDWVRQHWNNHDMNLIREAFEYSKFPNADNSPAANLHSNSNYHSIQFTCRQRVKIKRIGKKPISFFFPFEIQIMDQKSYYGSRMGDASHESYKRRQLISVRKRVLGPLYNKYGKIE